ncbi:MAG: tetratricopeptide repeat protein [Polyangiaceae bacterium]
MRYLSYYAMWAVLALVMRYPPLLIGIVVVVALRRVLPDPVRILQTLGRMRELRAQVTQNPANATARRDLALLYLSQARPKKALVLLTDALARFPDDAELLYLKGLACEQAGKYEEALAPLVRAVELDPAVRFGEPYRVAGNVLRKLGRLEEAMDAYERYNALNTSSVEGRLKLALVHHSAKDYPTARAVLADARQTWSQLPRFKRRRELGWWMLAVLHTLRIGW